MVPEEQQQCDTPNFENTVNSEFSYLAEKVHQLEERETLFRNKIRMLQQKLRRKSKRVSNLKQLITTLKAKGYYDLFLI